MSLTNGFKRVKCLNMKLEFMCQALLYANTQVQYVDNRSTLVKWMPR